MADSPSSVLCQIGMIRKSTKCCARNVPEEGIFDQNGKLIGTRIPKSLYLVREKINEYFPKIEQWKIAHPKVCF